MRRRCLATALVFTVAIAAAHAEAAEPPTGAALLKRSPQFKGLDKRYKVIALEEGDLDADGTMEFVAAFVSRRKGCGRGGFAVFSQRGGKFGVAWAGLYEHSKPETLSVAGTEIVSTVVTPSGRVKVALAHGKDFWFRGEKQSPFQGMRIRASSQVTKGPKAQKLAPANAVDGDTDTLWCPSAVGTGAGEWLEVEFAKAVPLGMVAVLGGDARSMKDWKNSNRLYRFEVLAETAADRTTIVEGTDLTKMLKLPSTGKRITSVAADARRSKWTEIRTRDVMQIKVQATSVYLGDLNDELYIAELDFGVLLPEPKEGKAASPAPPATKAAPAPAPAPARPAK
ncbi:MAG TPA: hypothetical protein VGK67_07020 [Myxococcales bacterium]|jgi:hypothetical protein